MTTAVSEEMIERALAEWSKPNERREPKDIMHAAISSALSIVPPAEALIESIELAIEHPQDINTVLLREWRDAVAALASPSAEAAQPVLWADPNAIRDVLPIKHGRYTKPLYDHPPTARSQPQGELREALAALVEAYVKQVGTKNDGFWNVEGEAVVIKARAALAERTAG
jgi:hypothetical protein